MTELEKYIQSYFGVTNEDLEKISSFFKPVSLKKGDYFLKTGRYSDRLGFLQSGIIREFVEVNDKEVTKWISTKGYFVVDLSSFIFQQPARWNIQALTDCELYVIDQKNYLEIGKSIPKWPVLEKLFIAKCFTILEDRILSHLSLSAEERYTQLFDFNKELFNTVPLQYLASMLGMTPETLSRLRKKGISSQ
jgi:CRP-like cAMP-binding protein